jgi:hypothetical protein
MVDPNAEIVGAFNRIQFKYVIELAFNGVKKPLVVFAERAEDMIRLKVFKRRPALDGIFVPRLLHREIQALHLQQIGKQHHFMKSGLPFFRVAFIREPFNDFH